MSASSEELTTATIELTEITEASEAEMKLVAGGLFWLPLAGGVAALGGGGAANLGLNLADPAGGK